MVVRRYLACLVGIVGIVALIGPVWRTGLAPVFPDSFTYLDVAGFGPWTLRFWIGDRPPTYPTLILLLGRGARAVVVVQFVAAIAAWVWLIVTVHQQIRSRAVATAATIGLVLVAIQPRWALWHGLILTESLSATLVVAGVTAWWRWFAAPDRFRIVVATALTGAWMLLRDSNAVTLAVLLVPAVLVVSVLDRRRHRPVRTSLLSAMGALLIVLGVSMAGQAYASRGETNLHNNVGLRWLVDADMRDWMVDRGMPLSPALEARAGKDAWADGEAFLSAPDLEAYRDWAEVRGRSAAVLSYVVRADWYLSGLWDGLEQYTTYDFAPYDATGVGGRLPDRLTGPVDPVGSRMSLVVWSLALVVSGLVVAVRRRRLAWLLPLWGLPIVTDLYLSYAGDAVEVGRHLIGPMFRFSVVAILGVAIAVDSMLGEVDATGLAPLAPDPSDDDIDGVDGFDGYDQHDGYDEVRDATA